MKPTVCNKHLQKHLVQRPKGSVLWGKTGDPEFRWWFALPVWLFTWDPASTSYQGGGLWLHDSNSGISAEHLNPPLHLALLPECGGSSGYRDQRRLLILWRVAKESGSYGREAEGSGLLARWSGACSLICQSYHVGEQCHALSEPTNMANFPGTKVSADTPNLLNTEYSARTWGLHARSPALKPLFDSSQYHLLLRKETSILQML